MAELKHNKPVHAALLLGADRGSAEPDAGESVCKTIVGLEYWDVPVSCSDFDFYEIMERARASCTKK